MAAAIAFDLQDAGKLMLRLAVAIVILFHGIAKLGGGVAWMSDPLGQLGLPAALAYGVYIAELIAPVMLIAGFKARIAALITALDMVMAIVLVLQPQVLQIKEAGGGWGIELEFLLLMSSIAIVFLGAGKYAVAHGRWD